MTIEFREFTNSPQDHQATAELTNTCYKNHVYTAEQVAASHAAEADSEWKYFCHFAYQGDKAIGFTEGGASRNGGWLEITVHPDHRGRGVGSRLYDLIHADLLGHNVTQIEAQIREDWAELEAFYTRRGFTRQTPWAQWKLELKDFVGVDYAFPPKIRISTLAKLRDTPDLRRTIYDLWSQGRQELRRESKPPYSYEQFQADVFEAFWFRPEAVWLALEKDRAVGVHWVAAYPDDPTVFLEWVSVLPSHRRRGIARALLVCGLEFAQNGHNFASGRGYAVAEANNSLADVEVNGLLEQLEFVRHPGYVTMVKTLT